MSNTEYLYQKPSDCYPEADLIQANVKFLTKMVRWMPSSIIHMLATGRVEKSTTQTYVFAEQMLYNDLMDKAPALLKKTYYEAGQTTAANTDLRPLLS